MYSDYYTCGTCTHGILHKQHCPKCEADARAALDAFLEEIIKQGRIVRLKPQVPPTNQETPHEHSEGIAGDTL